MNVTRNKPSRALLLPILVPAKPGEPSDGIANFLLEITRIEGGGIRWSPGGPVRLFRKKDVPAGDAVRKVLSPRDVDLLIGADHLRKAHDDEDELLAERAYERLWPFIENSVERAFKDVMVPVYASNRKWAENKFPQVVTKAVDDARIVMWFSPKIAQFTPAIYCPTIKVAIFIHMFLGGLRVCPYCSSVFIPLKKNVDYCSPAHRDAHRMQRWRRKKR
jgi:hypothetical protein